MELMDSFDLRELDLHHHHVGDHMGSLPHHGLQDAYLTSVYDPKRLSLTYDYGFPYPFGRTDFYGKCC